MQHIRSGGKVNREHIREYPHKLQLYAFPPTQEVSLEDFETFAVDRLKVLKAIELAKDRWPKRGAEYDSAVRDALRKHLPLSENEKGEAICLPERRKDHISHFVLRLVYCRSEELRRWFLNQELELFRFRFTGETKDQITEFLRYNNLAYAPISNSDKEQIARQLVNSSFGLTMDDVQREDYFRVPFLEALELVRNRKVYLQQGFAYVPRRELAAILLGVYRMRLSESLTATSRALPHLEEDERLLPLLNSLSKQYLGPDYNTTNKRATLAGQVTCEQVNDLSVISFAPCMRNLHQALRTHHHLKHGGRMQYGLFLKGIGMSLDEALKFWRQEFTKGKPTSDFDKNYAYNIRHNYGKEGKRADYTPYSCMKIITSNTPSSGDYHGCPFRHFDAEHLRTKLLDYGVKSDGIKEILGLVKDSHYQIACTKYFELTHGLAQGAAPMNVSHPNQYFEESQKILKAMQNGETFSSLSLSKQGTTSSATPSNNTSSAAPSSDLGSDLSDHYSEEAFMNDTDESAFDLAAEMMTD